MKRIFLTLALAVMMCGNVLAGQVDQPIDQVPDLADTSLVGAWLNKATVGTGDDLSSNGYDLSVVDTESWEEVGAKFDGADTFFTFTGPETNTGSITVSAWIYPESDGENDGGRVISLADGGYQSATGDSGGYIKFDVMYNCATTNARFISTKVIPINSWTHIASVYSGSDIDFYINGSLATSDGTDTACVGARTTTSGTWSVGNYGGSVIRTWDGKLKDVRVYNEAKTASFIKQEFLKGVPDNSLVLHVMDGDKDLSRYKHTLTNSGAILGNGMEFDGTNDYLNTGTTFQTTFDGSFTISLWVNPDDGVTIASAFLGTRNASSEDRVQITEESGKLSVLYKSNNNEVKATTNAAVWSNGSGNGYHNIVVVADSTVGGVGGLKIYYDGTVQTLDGTYNGNTSGIIFADFVTTTNLWIGAINNNGSWNTGFGGVIKDLGIYSSAKSADWVKENYERTRRNY